MAPALDVLLITLDQWRGDTLGRLGHPAVPTPHLDALAADGVTFTRHFGQTAPCGPARASLLTGCYSLNHRVVGNGTPLDRRFTNLALEARALGYDPVLFGYTDTAADPATLAPGDPRWRTYEDVLPGFRAEVLLTDSLVAWAGWLAGLGYEVPDDPRALYQPVASTPGADRRGRTWAPPAYAAEHSEAAFLTGEVLRYLDECDGPAFVHVSYLRPHPPWIAPAPYHDLVDPADVPPPTRAASREEEAAAHPLLARMLDVVPAPAEEREWRQWRATYYGMVAEVDAQLGRLVEGLRQRGRWDRTLVVLTSDHGEQLGDHWLEEKLGWFPESYHVPLVIRDPSPPAEVTRGTVVDRFTEHVDLVPTILDRLGAEVPLQCDGFPLTPFLHGHPPPTWRTEVHWEWDYRTLGRADGWPWNRRIDTRQLCVLFDDDGLYAHLADGPAVFYDRRDDPALLVNRADDPACAGAVRAYAERMLTWRMVNADRRLAGMLLSPRGPVGRVPATLRGSTPA